MCCRACVFASELLSEVGERDNIIDGLQAGMEEARMKFVGAQQQIDDLQKKVGDKWVNVILGRAVIQYYSALRLVQ